jgi:UPF0755 protein
MRDTVEKNGKQRNGRKLNKGKVIFRLVIPVLIILTTLICYFVSYQHVIESASSDVKEAPPALESGKGIEVSIPLGSGTASIAEILKTEGIIKHPKIFKIISKLNGYDGTYKSGTHVLSKDWSYTELMRGLSDKPLNNESIKVTIPEGKTLNEIVEILHKNNLIDKEKFIKLAESENFEFKFTKGIPKKRDFRLQGYLFPETYFFNKDGGEKEILDKMLSQFDNIFTEEYKKRAKELNMSIDDIITLASIIEREAAVPEERSKIAGVFYNRLKSKDATLRRLQSCASIQYIFFLKTGEIKDRILTEDTKVDDPYNTYIHEGLPPGPICCPGEGAINAALCPEENDFMYFVAKEDGSKTHFFSKTFKEHLSAQAKAQKNKK